MSSAVKPIHGKALISEFAIETLVGPVLPWLAGINPQFTQSSAGRPLNQRRAHKLGAVVAA